MQTGRTDPIIDEVRAIRRAYAARFDYDVEAIFKDISGQRRGCRAQPRLPPAARR